MVSIRRVSHEELTRGNNIFKPFSDIALVFTLCLQVMPLTVCGSLRGSLLCGDEAGHQRSGFHRLFPSITSVCALSFLAEESTGTPRWFPALPISFCRVRILPQSYDRTPQGVCCDFTRLTRWKCFSLRNSWLRGGNLWKEKRDERTGVTNRKREESHRANNSEVLLTLSRTQP